MRPPIFAAAAAFALLALAPAASAQDDNPMRSVPGYQPSAFELALDGFEARMAGYEARAAEIAQTPGLSDAEREARLAEVRAEQQADVTRLAVEAGGFGAAMAGVALESIDFDRLVEDSLASAGLAAEIEADMADAAGDEVD